MVANLYDWLAGDPWYPIWPRSTFIWPAKVPPYVRPVKVLRNWSDASSSAVTDLPDSLSIWS